jgi:hypothetical protein
MILTKKCFVLQYLLLLQTIFTWFANKKRGETGMLDHKKAMKLWEEVYGKAVEARDDRGRLINKAAYGQHGSQFGWDIHHKTPKNRGGTDAFGNLQIVHIITHDTIHGR